MRRILLIALVAGLLAAACGDDSAFTPSTTAPEEPSTTATSPTTAAETTTTAGGGDTSTTATTAVSPSAADALAEFFAAAEALDAEIRAAAVLFNAGFDSGANTLDSGVAPVVQALDAVPLGELIPGGLSLDLETAVLAVFTDLDGRVSALAGGVSHSELDWRLDCLGNGAPAAERFANDLSRAWDLARSEAPPAAAPDSAEAGILAVRLAAVHSMNWGCESCGGLVYDGALPVDWEGRTVADGVEFEATFDAGAWQIVIWAC